MIGENYERKGRWAMALPLAVLLGAILLGAVGQVCLKSGLLVLGERAPLFEVFTAMFRNWLVLGGFVAYGVSSLLWLFVLSRLPLSYAYPMVALNYVFVTILAWLVLSEVVPPRRILGLAIIFVGVVVFATSYSASRSLPDAERNAAVIEMPADCG
jgi:drug/metabolite transporter (DMT)-like permease